MSGKVLIVEDDQAMAVALRDGFEYEGYAVQVARDGAAGLKLAAERELDLIVLDVMLPKMSGFDVCKQLRSGGTETPIIMLTARGQEIDKVVGLELGADDYVTKPFSIRELMARVKAVLRRSSTSAPAPDIYRFSDVEVNIRSNEVRRSGELVDLSSKEFALLEYFIAHPVETLSRDRLLDAVWGYENYPSTRTVDTHIVHLRQKLEPNPEEPRFILTVHGSGYKFVG
jgi:two-component system alkaline phosphatase synthesis response regulator PhoP